MVWRALLTEILLMRKADRKKADTLRKCEASAFVVVFSSVNENNKSPASYKSSNLQDFLFAQQLSYSSCCAFFSYRALFCQGYASA